MSKLRGRQLILYAAALLTLLAAGLSSHFSILALPARTPHENPAQAEDSFDTASLLAFYNNVFQRALERRYENADAMLTEFKNARIPNEMRTVLDRYTALSRRLIERLNSIEKLLGEASDLISRSELGTARHRLDEAENLVIDAPTTLRDLELATAVLAERAGVSAAHASRSLLETHNRLKDTLSRLQELVNLLSQLRQALADDPGPGNPLVQAARWSAALNYPIRIEVSAPQEGQPGTTIVVTGEVISAGGGVYRRVIVLLDSTTMGEQNTEGRFRFEFMLPPEIPAGIHTITVLTDGGERPARPWSTPISVTKNPTTLEVSVPLFNVTPRLHVSGRVSAGPARQTGARVTVNFKKLVATVNTAPDGSFSTDLDVPFDPSLFGPDEVVVSAEPDEPWFSPATVRRRVFVISPASTGLMLAMLVFLGVLVYRRSRARPGRQSVDPEPPDTVTYPAVQPPPTEPRRHLTPAQAKLLAAYASCVTALAQVTGFTPAPHETFRQYARAVMSRLPQAGTSFGELTGMVEIALYSDHQIDDRAIAAAEALARLVMESWRGAA